MDRVYNMGLLGCGDYLRWMHKGMKNSERVQVKALFDPAKDRAMHYRDFFGDPAVVVESADTIMQDEEIDILLVFSPPWLHAPQVIEAAERGKHVITVKPLAPNLEDATAMVQAVEKTGVRCACFYGRTGDAQIETIKAALQTGEIGKLALYKQDWLHHYPTWNDWATDPEKNGGPFMDAMVHNLNKARYLMGREPVSMTFLSENYAQELKCNDTEFMKLDFAEGGGAYLWITWAGDYEVYDPTKNEREHLDYLTMVTDRGWVIRPDGKQIVCTKDDEKKVYPVEKQPLPWDVFVDCVETGAPLPWSLEDAWKDIALMDAAMKNPGQTQDVSLEVPR
jgi:myo-inositol 2-dehydrogenase/D-chiro-inositol 1-dehydrogenase